MIAFPPCKINLGLFVTDKRPDGFHNIESIFLPVALYDVLEVIAADKGVIQFNATGIKIEGKPEDNICLNAYKLLQRDFDLPGIKTHLHKCIPTGAGLGGGSSDGAFMLKLLNQIFHLQLHHNELMRYASQLGSDCPFFIDCTAKLVMGRGEILQQLEVDLKNWYVVIVHPGIHVSTATAYSKLKPKAATFSLEGINQIAKHEWKKTINNDFEQSVSQEHPRISEIKVELYAQGATYVSMSGSGSAVFALFLSIPDSLSTHFAKDFYWSGKLLE
ncbi:MAG: 4-(cytidine 5'-diphospho)-2-C-methyl-D-erythritol kinase [Flavobacteriales bacterium]